MRLLTVVATAIACLLSYGVSAQHLIWKYDVKDATCMYGEITVLATGPTIYYCGCCWWPGSPAGGYCGIQDAGGGRHLTIFSIWDTSPDLHPTVTEAEGRTKHNRFGGEGTGAHTHLDYDWPLKTTFRYFVQKTQAAGDKTETRYYYFDEGLKKWVHEATIVNPNGGHDNVKTFGGMLDSFLENWSGRSREVAKLATYLLWIGPSPKELTCLTQASGDGKWGVLGDAFYLAEGDDAALAQAFAGAKRTPGAGAALSVPPRQVPKSVLRELERLPRSAAVK